MSGVPEWWSTTLCPECYGVALAGLAVTKLDGPICTVMNQCEGFDIYVDVFVLINYGYDPGRRMNKEVA